MKYWAPINSPGGIDGNDPYINANPAAGIEGSIPTFQSFEQTLRALQNLVLKSNLAPNPALDDLQVSQATRAQWLNWATTFGGTANALTCNFDPAVGTLASIVGMPIRGIVLLLNTGAVTCTVNGLIAPLTFVDGSPLVGGELRPGAIIGMVCDGTKFQLIDGFIGGTNDTPWPRKMPGFFYANTPESPTTGWFTSLTPGVWTKVNCKLEFADYEGWYDAVNSKYQPQKPGFYYIGGDCSFGSSTGLPTTGLRAFKNGTPTFSTGPDDVPGSQYGTSGNGSRAVVAGTSYLNGTTDFLEMYAYQDLADSGGFWRATKLRWTGWFLGR